MTAPESGTYGQSVYAAGGGVARSGAPAFQRGLPGRQAQHLRRNPALPATVWLTVAEVAAQLRISKMTVYRAIHEGSLPSIRVRRSFRVDATDLASYLPGDASGAAARPRTTHPSEETSCPSTPTP